MGPHRRLPRLAALIIAAFVVVLTACGTADTTATGGIEPGGTDRPPRTAPVRTDPPPATRGTLPPTTEGTTAPVPIETATSAPPTTAARPAPPPPTPPPAPEPPPPPPTPTPPPLPPGPSSVFVLGDSVLLGTTYGSPPAMVAALPGWQVTLDCQGSRRLTQGLDVLRARRAEIGRVVVIQLGNNYIPGEGGSFASQIDEAMAILQGTDRVVWVTVGEALSGRAELNAEIRAAAARHPTIVVADWAALVGADPSLAPGDGLHLSGAGRVALSQLVAQAVGPAPG